MSAVISQGNASSALLGAGATFSGVFEDVSDFDNVAVHVVSDQPSAADGLIVDWSHDGVTVALSVTASYSAQMSRYAHETTRAKWFRLRYTNGATPQTTFLIYATYFTQVIPSRIFQRFVLNQGAAGTTLISAAVAGKRHKVLGITISLANDGTWVFKSNATNLMGLLKQDGQLQPVVIGPSEFSIVETALGEALNITTTQAAQGVIQFTTEP